MFVQRMLGDTGFFCRHVLGMNTDKNPLLKSSEKEGEGGIRDYGPHQEMVSAFDNFQRKLLVLLASRMAYKSSMVEGFIQRCILAYPNVSILLMMHDLKKAVERVQVIRDGLLKNEVIQYFFGDLRGKVWRQAQFTTALREDESLLDPTLSCGSPDALPTGGHFDIQVWDDIVCPENVRTPEGVQKGCDTVRYCMPLRGGMGIVRNVGTPYAENDAHQLLLEQPPTTWDRLILPAGMQVVRHDDGRVSVEGTPKWPHLTKEFLQTQLDIGFSFYMSQYELQVVGGMHQSFKREQFIPVSWKEEYKDLTGYLLTDVSTTDKTDGALNVLIYVGLDERRRLHILDCEIGRWPYQEFCDRFLNMASRWQAKVNHEGELMETAPANNTYKALLYENARKRSIRLNIITVISNQSDRSKDERILGLQGRFQCREVFVCNDTVPRTWVNEATIQTLWDPEGYIQPHTGARLPDGEMVIQFTRHPTYRLKDIPDALSRIDAQDKQTGTWLCFYKKPPDNRETDDIMRRPAPAGARGLVGSGTMARFYNRATRGGLPGR